MVPGSTLMYGSSFTMVTLRPRASRMAPKEAAAMPFPNEETTPPVTNTNWVIGTPDAAPGRHYGIGKTDYQKRPLLKSALSTGRVFRGENRGHSAQRRM